MRHVYRNPPEKDTKEGHKQCRKLLNENPDKYMARLADLEKSHTLTITRGLAANASKAAKPTATGAAGTPSTGTASPSDFPVGVDDGSNRSLDALSRLLTEWADSSK